MEITMIGLDLAKNVFQVHAVSSTGEVIVRRALRRAQVLPFFSKLPPCLVGMEARGTSHHCCYGDSALNRCDRPSSKSTKCTVTIFLQSARQKHLPE